MKRPSNRIEELQRKVERLERELAKVNARNADPPALRGGQWLVKPVTDIDKGGSDDCAFYAGEQPLGFTKVMKALVGDCAGDAWCIGWLDQAGNWYVFPGECP